MIIKLILPPFQGMEILCTFKRTLALKTNSHGTEIDFCEEPRL